MLSLATMGTFVPLSLWIWLSWLGIGTAMGLFVGKSFGGRRMTIIETILALGGSLVGGFGSAVILGYDSPQLFIVSDLGALFVSGGVLWLAGLAFMNYKV